MSSFTSSTNICLEFESIFTTDPRKRRYNVFLSFYAQDKGYFLSNLEEALSLEAGIDVFGVIKRFQHGERAESVLNVIQDCKVAIVPGLCKCIDIQGNINSKH
ncbi:putative TIR domain-containing protein [Medicago truncatula]|uniref:Putative TIR domain-containing protein n=1 Tax=Medicago truncatula TaxID=3880 RepID=A0A396JQW3_MEDTR|nr:putative TIR domain-containing protein [Medicago truncatula]